MWTSWLRARTVRITKARISELPLHSLDGLWKPTEWAEKWDSLMQDPWLRRKLDRKRRLREHANYLQRYVPELFEMNGAGTVIDIGPGAGELLEIVRHLGHSARGIDAPSGEGGMGDKYLQACKLMHARQGLIVIPCGLWGFCHWLSEDREFASHYRGRCFLINMRGSIEQCFANHMQGPPHHEHHDCNRLAWQIDDNLEEAFDYFAETMSKCLRPLGFLLIHANGGRNEFQAYRLLRDAMKCYGLRLNGNFGEARVLRFRKQS